MNSLMQPAKACNVCGAEIPRGAPEGICIACLLDRATDEESSSPNPAGSSSLAPHYFGDYEILGEAGRGGMGIVYKARQFGTHRLVALKLLAGGALAHHDAIHRFHVEARAAASLVHPCIVPVFECGVHESQYFLAMPFFAGGTLAATLQGKPMPARRAAEILCQIAQAVAFAHQRGVLHRDLKPGNILLDEAGQPCVADFGLARITQEETGLTFSGVVVGTAAYMAPEQAAGEPVTTASDVYARCFTNFLPAGPQSSGPLSRRPSWRSLRTPRFLRVPTIRKSLSTSKPSA